MAFPHVPIAPGVPALSRDPSVAIQQVALLTQDAIAFFLGFGQPQWGIFKDGVPVVIADSVISVEYRQGWNISDYPVEQGGFESFNKVGTPYVGRVRFATGGSASDRAAMLESIAAIAGDLNAYDIVTAEQVYINANVEQFDFRRTATSGMGLVAVDVMLTEIRVNAQQSFSNTQTPSGASAISGGSVQTETATNTQQAIATGASGSGQGLFF